MLHIIIKMRWMRSAWRYMPAHTMDRRAWSTMGIDWVGQMLPECMAGWKVGNMNGNYDNVWQWIDDRERNSAKESEREKERVRREKAKETNGEEVKKAKPTNDAHQRHTRAQQEPPNVHAVRLEYDHHIWCPPTNMNADEMNEASGWAESEIITIRMKSEPFTTTKRIT